jgi:polysaccharide biosynthesis/export protein
MKIRSYILLLSLILSYVFVFSQEKQAVKQQAEKELQNASPDQVKSKIKEAGMTEKEAKEKAAALGIDLQQYLDGLPQQQGTQLPEDNTEAGKAQSVNGLKSTSNSSTKTEFVVPGFEKREIAIGLQPFGYNIFQFPTSTFEPVLNLPTASNYLLGPGDEILLTLWGETQLYLPLTINREGNVVIPNVGPVVAQGVTIEALKSRLMQRMTAIYSGLKGGAANANTWLDVSTGKLRTIQVFVLGEVTKPGGYAISSMSTSFLALYVAGGPTINGSLRDIDVLRNNKLISQIDFYDYVLHGDKSKDIRLQDGDVVFVHPVGKRVALAGNVIHPAIYETKTKETLNELIVMAGGLQVNAYSDRVHVERIIPFSQRKLYLRNILDIDLPFASVEALLNSNFELENGDIVSVLMINNFLQNRVQISGNVKKPGIFELRKDMRIHDLVVAADSLLSDTFGERADVTRVLPDGRREILPFNLNKAMANDPVNNLELESEDEVKIYKQNFFFPEHTVSIAGSVRKPGSYLRMDSMTVADLVVMAGGLTEEASKKEWELAKMDTMHLGQFSTITKFDINDKYWDDRSQLPIYLKDYDHIVVPTNPKFNLPRTMSIQGYVMYPGMYIIQRENERLSSLVKRAGGLRNGAYLEGATLTRTWRGAGLVPIDFQKALDDTESLENVSILPGDVINIPFIQQVVLVRGEVFVPSAVVYKKGAGLKYYIEQAGGITDSADVGKTFVTLPNGRKWQPGWFILPDPDILGGSTVYVPKLIEKEDKSLQIMASWATVMASIATMMIAIVQVTK